VVIINEYIMPFVTLSLLLSDGMKDKKCYLIRFIEMNGEYLNAGCKI